MTQENTIGSHATNREIIAGKTNSSIRAVIIMKSTIFDYKRVFNIYKVENFFVIVKTMPKFVRNFDEKVNQVNH